MKQIYRFSILVVFLLFAIGFAQAQDTLNVASLTKDGSNSTWHLLKQQGSVKIYYQLVDCGSLEFVNFKAENTSNQSVTLNWNFQFLANGSLLPSNPDDVNVQITIPANGSEWGACFSSQNTKLSIFIREANLALGMDSILLSNLSIN